MSSSMCSMCYYFSTGSKFQPVSNFTELHALTLAVCSYALLDVDNSLFMCALIFIQSKVRSTYHSMNLEFKIDERYLCLVCDSNLVLTCLCFTCTRTPQRSYIHTCITRV